MNGRERLTLDRPMTYEIRVPGEIDKRWTDWNGEAIVAIETGEGRSPVTILTSTVDQAGLHGLLRRLYTLGLPLISVICVDLVGQPR